MNLPTVSRDKERHVIYGAAAGLVGAFVGTYIGVPPWQSAAALAALLGVALVMVDKLMDESAPDVVRGLATVAGGAAIALGTLA